MNFDHGFSTAESRRLFSAQGRLCRMLDAEAALARASADAELISRPVAEVVVEVCSEVASSLGERMASDLFATGWVTGSPVIPLVEKLREVAERRGGSEAAVAVHLGATTQDIVDTGFILQIREGLGLAEYAMARIAKHLAALAEAHRGTWMRARTLLQPATSTTFGFKAAGWLEPILHDLERCRELSGRLPVQLGGIAGDLAAFKGRGAAVCEAMAQHLGLSAPRRCWHTHRWPVLDTASSLAGMARTASKIAVDLILLAQDEVAEVTMRPGRSSVLPGKRNPIDAVRVRAASQVALGQAAALLVLPPHEHERAAGAWQAEWALIPLLFQATLAALEALDLALSSLRVDAESMASKLATVPADAVDLEIWIQRILDAYERLS